MRRIDAPVRYLWNGGAYASPASVPKHVNCKYRIVEDSDYRKLLAVARAAEKHRYLLGSKSPLCVALDALNKPARKTK